jgi:hypothetical protein
MEDDDDRSSLFSPMYRRNNPLAPLADGFDNYNDDDDGMTGLHRRPSAPADRMFVEIVDTKTAVIPVQPNFVIMPKPMTWPRMDVMPAAVLQAVRPVHASSVTTTIPTVNKSVSKTAVRPTTPVQTMSPYRYYQPRPSTEIDVPNPLIPPPPDPHRRGTERMRPFVMDGWYQYPLLHGRARCPTNDEPADADCLSCSCLF